MHCCNNGLLELPCCTCDLVVAKTVEVAEIQILLTHLQEILDTTNPDWAPAVDLGHDKIFKFPS